MILLLLLLLPLILIYPRLISFEIYRGGGSMCQDGTLSAGQAGMPVCAAHWSDRSQNSEGTRRADWPQNGFAYFCRFKSRSA